MVTARNEVLAAVAKAVDLTEGGVDVFDAAARSASNLSRDALVFLAQAAIVDQVRARQREDSLEVERLAMFKPRTSRPRRGTKAFDIWVDETAEGQAWLASERQLAEEWEPKARAFAAKMSGFIDDFATELRMQWTEELLATEFGLADGTRVTWGSATIDQHNERRDMFMANAQANAEGAARHTAAIRALEESGARCLDNLRVAA